MPTSDEPTPNTEAPASRKARTSSALLMPPQPMIGRSQAAAISRTHFSAMGSTPLPEMPPMPLLSTGLPWDEV